MSAATAKCWPATREGLICSRLLFAACLLVAQSLAVAGAGRQALDDFLDGLTTLQAKFEQSALDSENATTGLMHGLFLLQRPGKFRWDYVAPRKQVILADGRDVWIIEEELKQVTQHYQRWALAGTPAAFHYRTVGRQGLRDHRDR